MPIRQMLPEEDPTGVMGTMQPPAPPAPAEAAPPMAPESGDQGTADLESHLAGTGDLESHAGPHMNPMLHPTEEPAPQGPPPPGKEQFHNTMADFDHRAEANRAAMIGLDPEDPDYVKKLSALQAQHGALTTEKARYQMLHPWGSPESAHPGVLGKIGHIAGKIGEVAGGALAPGVVQSIPGTQSNLAAQAASGEKEIAGGVAGGEKAAQTAEAEARVPAIEAGTAHTQAETTDLQNKPAPAGPAVAQQYADAVRDAQARGVDPATDPKVQQLADAQTSIQKQPVTPAEKLDQQYQDALATGDHEKAERILKVKADLAKAGQAPQRPPQTMVVLPGGQTAVARPGMTLPEGTQNIGGYATLGRPTTQMRNVNAQAQVASEGIQPTIQEIQTLKDQLGPVAGRWSEFMQGKVGMENPQMAGLRADLLMLSSAVALAHARGRLPENLREEFDSVINSPRQSPENLIATLQHIEPWMKRMGQMGNETSNTSSSTQGGGGSGGGEEGDKKDPLKIR